MATRRYSVLFVTLIGAALQGCSSTPHFNDHFGEAVRTNLSAQVLDPAASSNVDPVRGVDGSAAVAAQERYQRSFKETDAGAARSMMGNSTR